MLFADKMILDEKPRRTADGYLVAIPKIARTGIQEYTAAEVNLTDRDPADIIKVYRPHSEVFHKDAMHSMAHRPVTIDHPPELVDAKNWKNYARGMTGEEVVRDKEFIRVPMVLMDFDAIEEVEAGKAELSMGYTADLDYTPGSTPDGEQYDAIQRNIKGNHLAIVDAARGGSQLRVIDTKQHEENIMSLRKVVIDGITVETTDTAAEVYDKHIKDMEEKAKTDAEKIKELEDELEMLKKKEEDQEKEKETTDAKIATLQKQLEDSKLTPAKLDDAVKARAQVIDSAKKILPDVAVDGKSDGEIRKAVVISKLGDTAKDWNDDQIAASFNTLTASTTDSYRQVVQAGDTKNQDQARTAYVDRISNAWKQPKEA